MALVSAKEMVDKAHEGHYAIPAFNIRAGKVKPLTFT